MRQQHEIDKKPRLLNLQKAKMGAQQAWTCVGDAARRDFGFEAEVSLAEGIRLTHEWYLANDWYQSLQSEGSAFGPLTPRLGSSPRSLPVRAVARGAVRSS